MNDLRGLAQHEMPAPTTPTLDELVNRIAMLAQPYAFELNVDPLVSARLVGYIARVAAGIIREQQIAHLRAQKVIVRDERG